MAIVTQWWGAAAVWIGGAVIGLACLLRLAPEIFSGRGRSRGHSRRIVKSHQLFRKLLEVGAGGGPRAQFAYLRKVDPFVIEEFVLGALERHGHRIRRNDRYTGDGGIDGCCWIDDEPHLIQVKRYKGHIDAADVREFAGLCRRMGARGLFVHTGRTGKGAASEKCEVVEIVSGRRLLEFLGISVSEVSYPAERTAVRESIRSDQRIAGVSR